MQTDILCEVVLDEAGDPYCAVLMLYLMERLNTRWGARCYADGYRVSFRVQQLSRTIAVRPNIVELFVNYVNSNDAELTITSITYAQLGDHEELQRVWNETVKYFQNRNFQL